MQLSLIRNPDILSEVAALDDAPFTLGFAAETENVEAHAKEKRLRKNLDMIAANQVGVAATGFENDTNEILLLWQGGKQLLPLTSKIEIARQLIDLLADRYLAKNS